MFDHAGLLTADSIAVISQAVYDAAEQSQCAFYVATYRTPSNVISVNYEFMYTGEDFLAEQGLSMQDDIVLLVITLDDGAYYYDMYYYGDAPSRIPSKEVNYILDHDTVYDSLKSGELEAGSCAFLSLAAKAYCGRVGASYVVIAIVSFGIALLIGIGACAGVKTAYSMKKRSVDYPLNRFAKMELKEQNDIFVGSFVTKRVIQSSSGGGGRSSHGGGRGHAGGR